MSANVNAMIRAGQQALKAGNKDEARRLLEKAVEVDQYNETAWLWLSAVVDTKEEQQTCLQNVLVVNPDNERAKMGLRSMGIDPDSLNMPDDMPEEDDFIEDDFDPYAVETSSASSYAGDTAGDNVEEVHYDDWVDGLNLNTGGDNSTMAVTPAFDDSMDYFDDDDLFGDASFDEDFDAPVASTSSTDDSGIDFDDDLLDDDFEDYGDSSYFDDSEEFDEDFADERFEEDFVDEASALDDFSDAIDDDIHGFDAHDEFDDFDLDEHLDDDKPAEPGVEDYFKMIPREISAASRLPGEDMPAPVALMAVAGLLLVLNIGAIMLVVSKVV